MVNANASKLLKEEIIEIYNLPDINELRIFLTMLVYPETKNVYENGWATFKELKEETIEGLEIYLEDNAIEGYRNGFFHIESFNQYLILI